MPETSRALARGLQKPPHERGLVGGDENIKNVRNPWTIHGAISATINGLQKITFAEMRSSGVRELLIYCADYRCSHSAEMIADQWADDVRLSDTIKAVRKVTS